jgi:hypothetical protein
MVSRPQVGWVGVASTSGQSLDVVDSVRARVSTDVADVGGSEDATVALLPLASAHALVVLTHATALGLVAISSARSQSCASDTRT